MAPKTTSGSGFHFIFEFGVLELIENDIYIDRVCRRLFEIFRVSLKYAKIMQMSYMHSKTKFFMAVCRHCGPIPQRLKLGNFVENSGVEEN